MSDNVIAFPALRFDAQFLRLWYTRAEAGETHRYSGQLPSLALGHHRFTAT